MTPRDKLRALAKFCAGPANDEDGAMRVLARAVLLLLDHGDAYCSCRDCDDGLSELFPDDTPPTTETR